MTENDVRLLRHMLGWTDPYLRDPPDNRNYGAFTPGDKRCERLEAAGLIRCYRKSQADDDAMTPLDMYEVTDAGKEITRASFYKRRKGKAARRYHVWLRISDTWSELTFREFLTSDDPDLSKARRDA